MADTQGINDSAAGEPATPQSIIERPVDGQLGGAPKPPDGMYRKAILKGEIKITKLNSDKY